MRLVHSCGAINSTIFTHFSNDTKVTRFVSGVDCCGPSGTDDLRFVHFFLEGRFRLMTTRRLGSGSPAGLVCWKQFKMLLEGDLGSPKS